MKTKYFSAAMLVLLPTHASSQIPTSLRLDAPSDQTRIWQPEDITEVDHIHGRFQFLTLRSGKSYPPAIQLDVMSHNRDATLEMAVAPDGRHLMGLVTLFEGDEKLNMQKVTDLPLAGEEFEVDVKWTTEGHVVFDVSSSDHADMQNAYEIDMAQPVDDFAVSVGSAEVQIDNLELNKLAK